MQKDTVLIIGALGQIGTELTEALQQIYGQNHVIAADIVEARNLPTFNGIYEHLNVLDKENTVRLIKKHNVTQIYLLAAVLSARGEQNPMFAWRLNMEGLFNILEIAIEHKISKIFWPSSIAVFGTQTPRDNTPQHTVTDPTTAYGISKFAGERWVEYYFLKHGLDIRSIRYPGLISHKAMPGGGTTDYAVDIYHKALENNFYECFLSERTYLPMMYMPDALRATLELMHTDAANVKVRSSYNVGAMSFAPLEIAAEIQKHIPDFKIAYQPDFRQQIADGWPKSIDDTQARLDWNWKPEFDLAKMTTDMLDNLRKRL